MDLAIQVQTLVRENLTLSKSGPNNKVHVIVSCLSIWIDKIHIEFVETQRKAIPNCCDPPVGVGLEVVNTSFIHSVLNQSHPAPSEPLPND